MARRRQHLRPWTPAEKVFVRKHVGKLTHQAIARKIGRTRSAVKNFTVKFAIKTARFWTPAQIAYLQAHPKDSARQIAQALGRPERAVWNKRTALGIARGKVMLTTPVEAVLRAKHALGWSDSEIARELHCERHSVGDWRDRLGLASNALSEHRRLMVSAKTQEQCRKAGAASLGEIRAKAFRKYAVENGWPEDLRPRHVQILNAIMRNGPMTRRQLADAIGVPWKGSRASLHSNDPEGSYLAHLIKRGLVVSLGRVCRGRGLGRSTQIYSIPLWTERSPRGQVNSQPPRAV